PHAAHQLLAREDLAWVRGEEPEEVELACGEAQRLAAASQLACAAVELELAECQCRRRRLGGSRAAQDGADARRELARREGLRDVVVRAELEPDDAIGLLAARGQHDHWQLALRAD